MNLLLWHCTPCTRCRETRILPQLWTRHLDSCRLCGSVARESLCLWRGISLAQHLKGNGISICFWITKIPEIGTYGINFKLTVALVWVGQPASWFQGVLNHFCARPTPIHWRTALFGAPRCLVGTKCGIIVWMSRIKAGSPSVQGSIDWKDSRCRT